MRNRSDVLNVFKDYKLKVEKQTGSQIKKLRTDNGKEYTSNAFKNFLKNEGITHQLSVEYTPQQNGVAERKNRTLVEMARCIMLQGNLPQSLWAEAINTATYLRNRCATKTLNGKTPFEAWTERKPYVGFFRIIGSKAIVLDKARKRGKFYPKGDEYVLVGYSQESKAYRLWKPGTKTVVKARDVRFFERLDLINTPTRDPSATFNDIERNDNSNNIPIELTILEDEGCREEDEGSDTEELITEDITQGAINEEDNKARRGRGRPKLLRTKQPGRPRKIYCTRNARIQDPESVPDALNSDNDQA